MDDPCEILEIRFETLERLLEELNQKKADLIRKVIDLENYIQLRAQGMCCVHACPCSRILKANGSTTNLPPPNPPSDSDPHHD